MQNVIHNWQRFARLVLRGTPEKVFFPDKKDGSNNLEKILTIGETMINTTLITTLNQTTMEVLQNIQEFPEETAKNMICLAPNIIRKIRDMNAMENPARLQRKLFQDLHRVTGKYLDLYYYIPSYILKTLVSESLLLRCTSLIIIFQPYTEEGNEVYPGM